MENAKKLFLDTVKKYSMFSPGDTVMAGVSGGADSVCLLLLLLECGGELGINVEAAHVNHCLRGAESDADEEYVRSLCSVLGVKLHVLNTDVGAISALSGESTELAARKVRYDYFASLKADKTATAHTGSDAVETMLMNISRGATLHGVASIPPVRGSIVRPLICFTREMTEAYCAGRSVAFVTDSTNLSDAYTRNKYRLGVIPVLKEVNPAFEENALGFISAAREEDAFLDSLAEKLLCEISAKDGLELAGLKKADPVIAKRALRLWFSSFPGADPGKAHFSMIMSSAAPGAVFCIPGAGEFAVSGGFLAPKPDSEAAFTGRTEISLYGETVFNAGGAEYRCCPSSSPEKGEGVICLDCGKLSGTVTARPRLPGDSIVPGRGRPKKTLKKLFNEDSVPLGVRASLPVFEDGAGVFAVGVLYSDPSRRPGPGTVNYFVIKKSGG